jgi:hypothetical protein
MEFKFLLPLYNFFLKKAYKALERAYEASKKIRNLHRNYLSYKSDKSYRRSLENAAMYMYTTINKLESEIYWQLVDFKISTLVYSFVSKTNSWFNEKNMNTDYLENNITNFERNRLTAKRLAWIEAVLLDLDLLKNNFSNESNAALIEPHFHQNDKKKWLTYFNPKSQNITYDSIGLVPRSIIRTISRFTTELKGQSASLVISEFRLAKYQAVASLQYLGCLLFLPWMVSTISKNLFFEPFAENWWNNSHFQIFLCIAQQEKALEELKNVEELLWLDTLMYQVRDINNSDLITEIREASMKLANKYNHDSINTVINPFTDLVAILTIGLLLIWGKKRLTILNSWSQEVFHSLSDTMKAFVIVFFADLCIGFHSRHGWEVLTRLFLEHLGFPYSKPLISCFTSIAPVIFHTLFKYWVFRDLSRISPSIVANYDAMNE